MTQQMAQQAQGGVNAVRNTLNRLNIQWGKYCASGCEDIAVQIQKAIGGKVHRITPSSSLPGAPTLGQRGNISTGWYHHDVVVRNGRVYDQLTGPNGASIADYKAEWLYNDVIDFGF